jgi:hypothetical protein
MEIRSVSDALTRYRFDADEMIVESSKKNHTGITNLKYDGIVNSRERKDAFYLFIAKNRGFVFMKDDMDEAQQKALRALFVRKLGKRFKALTAF